MDGKLLTSSYFDWAHDLLLAVEPEGPGADQVKGQLRLFQMDMSFLKAFGLYHESCFYDTDEESRERLTSIITHLRLIWPAKLQIVSLIKHPLDKHNDKPIQDFHSASFELEAKIQQSKQLVEGWCENSMDSLIQRQSLSAFNIWKRLSDLRYNLKDFSRYRTVKTVSLKKQIDLLEDKIVFLVKTFSWDNIKPFVDGKEVPPFVEFLGDFANSAACLACLYWAKEDNEEIATGMNIVLFEMLHKFIPYAYDLAPLYITILKPYHSHQSDSLLLRETVESFVDFFFKHLATILKDDFLILRERLIFLFTFLSDPPNENAQVEDLIRTQIYALFCEDYLLLSFDEMKEDFADKQMLLCDFFIKIDITIAKIRQLHCGFSDPWIKVEVEKMEYIYFVSVQRELFWIEKHAEWAKWDKLVLGQLGLYRMELGFLKVFLRCFATWDDTDEKIRATLSSMITSFQWIWERKEEKGLFAPRLHAIRTGGIKNWQPLASELETKIQLSKLEIKAWLVNAFHLPFRCRPSKSHEIVKFLDNILDNLNNLASCKAGEILRFKKQIETLKDKLVLMKNFLKLAANCIDSKEMREFNMFAQVFANDAACLTFIYWAKDTNDETAYETNSMLSHMLQKIIPATPDVARLYFGTLNSIYVQRSDSFMFGQTVSSFVDFFLDGFMTHLKDDFQIIHDDIIFLLTFLNNPPNENAGELIGSQIDVLFWEGVYGLLPFDGTKEDFSKKKMLLSDFMVKIESVNGNIRQLYGKFPGLSFYNFPKVISPGFLDFLIQNLRQLKERMRSDHNYVPFAKYKITRIEEELVSLCPFFNHIFDLQSQLNETWLEVVNLVQLTEHVIRSCINSWFVYDHPIWYHMSYLYDVLDRIKVAKTKLEMIIDNTEYNARCLPSSAGSSRTPSVEAIPLEINEIVIGYEDEAEKVIGNVIRGSMSLDIVSIVGMGGLGKTTLAKKVYSSSLVKCCFHVFAFCCVSQNHNTRKLLLDILCDIGEIDDRLSNITDDDLKHKLWKCLSRQKYLVVLDDMWNASVWNEVKSSFPDDKNGSRVMLTTRDCEVADICKINCSPHQLRFMSEVESWNLLQKKVFHNGISPPYLYEVGKLISKSCKGLPLAVIVIAGLLARTEKNLKWWSEIAERVVSYLSDEGCMKILELSYMRLPEKLKPCLLYLGAFMEDTLIRVKEVTLLWIAEGFIQESRTKSIDDAAKDYFNDLVARSLIIASKRSSNGEIKTFRVHDLIHEFCQTKCWDMNFFHLDLGTASSNSLNPSINYYRVSLQKHSNIAIDIGSTLSKACSVLLFSAKIRPRLREFRLAQVLSCYLILEESDTEQLSSLVHLRHIDVVLSASTFISIPSSISNIWNIGSLILASHFGRKIHLPETFWRMKSLRHVKVDLCILKFSDDHAHEEYPKLDKVISFSKPILSTGKDVQQLLQRLPAVRKLSCILEESLDYDGVSVETVGFHRKLESLKLALFSLTGGRDRYLINFPSTLKKLTLRRFHLPWTTISAIAELHCLKVLKLRRISFPGKRLGMEDLTFQNLIFFELDDEDLVEWNASIESLPCLEQLVIKCPKLEELPPCFGEISTLKRIVVRESLQVESSALRIRDELMELGNEVEVSIYNR